MKELAASDRQHHFHFSTNPVQFAQQGGLMVTRAEGVYIYTDDGRKIIDAGSGLSNVNIGYGNRRICDAAYRAMQELSFAHSAGGRSHPGIAALSKKLAQITPESFQHFSFASIGSDAMETAIKMAWHYWRLRGQPKKRMLLSRRHSYHGNTIVAASLSGLDTFHAQFGLPLSDIVQHVDAPYHYRYGKGRSAEEFGREVAASLEKTIEAIGAENIAAFIAEPVVAAIEMYIPPQSYWSEVRRICDRHGILLIGDEIITGFGKTGRWFGFEHFGYEPDLFVMAKGLSSGYFPISSIAIGPKVSEVLRSDDAAFMHIFTNCGHPVGAAVALENIAIMEEERLVERVREDIGPYFAQRLQEFISFPCVGEVRSLGVLGAIEVDMSKLGPATMEDNKTFNDKVSVLAFEKGLVMRASGMVLPMIITRAQVDEVVDLLKQSFAETLRCSARHAP